MALSLLAVFGFAALAVDLGELYAIRAQLQVTASASAAAAALDLPDESAAASTAVTFAEDNMPASVHGAVLSASDVVTGNWDEDTRTFTASGTPVNAVRVTAHRDSSAGNAVGTFFGQFLGVIENDVSATATATQLPALLGAVGANGSVTITGNTTIDSYDSTEGPYDPANPGSNGDIAAGGDVSVGGSAEVNGDVSAGGTVSTGNNVTGTTSESRRPINYPSINASSVENNNDNDSLPLIQQGNKLVSPLDEDGNFTLTGGKNYDMPPGVYLFNDLSLGGQSSINISGPTDIYLTGDLDTSGGKLINSTENPNNLRIFMTGGIAVLNASIDWYGLLYAPDTNVSIKGSADIYGAIVGNNVTASGTGDIHFDEGLDIGDDLASMLPKRSSIVQ
jgi:Putative Tad-like Flp pilus-assembly